MKTFYNIIIGCVFSAICGVILASCVASPPTTNIVFAGTYKLARSCYGDTVTYTINAGNNDATVYLPIYPDSTPSCGHTVYLPCVVSGHNITAVPQNVYDACNYKFSYSVSGTLLNNILTLNWIIVTEGNVTTYCTYTGLKQ